MIIGYKLIHKNGNITITSDLLYKTDSNDVVSFETLTVTEI